MAGHSFGGATAIRTSQFTNLFKCVIAYDPWMMPIEKSLLEKPQKSVATLVSNSAKFQSNAHVELIINYLKAMNSSENVVKETISKKRFVSFKIKNTAHDHYSDIPSVLPKIPFFNSATLLDHSKVLEIIFKSTFEFLSNCNLVSMPPSLHKSAQETFFSFNTEIYPDVEAEYDTHNKDLN
jgi:hypothetical protein